MEAFLDDIFGPITDYFENDYYLAAAKLLEVKHIDLRNLTINDQLYRSMAIREKSFSPHDNQPTSHNQRALHLQGIPKSPGTLCIMDALVGSGCERSYN